MASRFDYDVGILVVHGIGEQPRGDTLVRFGEPILDWLRRWLRGRGSVALEEAQLGEGDSPSQAPARFIVSIESHDAIIAHRGMAEQNLRVLGVQTTHRGEDTPSEGRRDAGSLDAMDADEHRWVVAESWWAPHFQRPQFGSFANWLLSRGPWVIIAGYMDNTRRFKGWPRLLALLGVPGALLLGLLAQIIVAAVAILALVPWPRLQVALSGLLLKLTGTLGDSYVLTESEVQRSAAVTQVRTDIQWLACRCSDVVVIAHSQGTAIAREALSKCEGNVSLFVTFGQGLKKLELLRIMKRDWKSWYSALGFLLPLCAVALVLSPYPPTGFPPQYVGYLRWFLLTYPAVALGASLVSVPDIKKELDAMALPGRTRWVDFHSSADFVPGGELEVPGVVGRPVHNLLSVVRDHTAYWDNRDQFVGPLLVEIDRVARSRLFDGMEVKLVEEVAKLRLGRVVRLALVRWACVLSVPIGAYGLRSELEPIGLFVYRGLEQLPLLGGTLGQLETVGALALGIICLVLLIFGWHAMVARLWRTWDTMALSPLFEPITSGDHREQKVIGGLVVLFGFVPLILALASVFGQTVGDLGKLTLQVVWLTPLMLATVGVALLGFYVVRARIKKGPAQTSGDDGEASSK